jgi:hypothetical protein
MRCTLAHRIATGVHPVGWDEVHLWVGVHEAGSMMIEFVCQCGKKISAKPENEGRRGICPGCRRTLVIPGRGQPVQYLDDPTEPVRQRQRESDEAKLKVDERGLAAERPRRKSWRRDVNINARAVVLILTLFLGYRVVQSVTELASWHRASPP